MQYELDNQPLCFLLFFINFILALEPTLLVFFYNEETLQWLEYGKEELNEVETLWTVGASKTHISPKWVINAMQSHSTGGEAIMIKLMENCS